MNPQEGLNRLAALLGEIQQSSGQNPQGIEDIRQEGHQQNGPLNQAFMYQNHQFIANNLYQNQPQFAQQLQYINHSQLQSNTISCNTITTNNSTANGINNNFNIQEFQSIHSKKKAIVNQAKLEQDRLINEWILPLEQAGKELEMIQEEIEAIEIIDSKDKKALSELKGKKASTLRRYLKLQQSLQERVESLFQKQQSHFQIHGFPFFKVTNDLEEISNQMWILQSYLT